MNEPTIICPSCKTEIRLTESLAAPLLESTRHEYEKRLTQKDIDIAKREAGIREREDAIVKAREHLDEQVDEKVRAERGRIAAEEARKAKVALQNDLDLQAKEITDLHEVLSQRDAKLAEAQKAQADLLRKQRELDDAKREIDLTVEKRVHEGLCCHSRTGQERSRGGA